MGRIHVVSMSQIRAPVFKAHWPHLPLMATMRCLALLGARVLIRQWESPTVYLRGWGEILHTNPRHNAWYVAGAWER